ncbi:MAG: outer membrane lipoprotein-sorting protein [Gammaproteobacteria bacterium]
MGLSFPVLAEGPSIDEIVNHTNLVSYYQGHDGRAKVEMTITDSQGRVRNRSMTILRRDASDTDETRDQAYLGEQKYYVYFHRPADVNKMVFLVWKYLNRDDDRWLYLPALDLVKRIAATDKRTSFVGSDFFYEDVSGRSIEDDNHELLETTGNYYVVKNTPKQPDSVEFSYYTMYIHKKTFVPVQVEFFDKNGAKTRVAKALKVDTIQGYPTVTMASMENLATGSKTEMHYSDVAYDLGLEDELFSERYLRNPPIQQLR